MKKSILVAFLIGVALAACASPTPSVTTTPTSPTLPTLTASSIVPTDLPAGFTPICGRSGILNRGISLSVESDLGEHPGWTRYIDPDTGFTFVFPTGWKIYQKDSVICLSSNANPGQKLVIAFKSPDSSDVILQPAQSNAESSSGGQIVFLNQQIDKELLESGGQLMAVLYHSGDEVNADGLSFSLSYGNWRTQGDESPLSDEDTLNADLILQSFSLVKVTHWTSTSPDGSLRAVQTRARPPDNSEPHQVYQRVDIVNKNGSVVWTPIQRWQERALGMTFYQPVRWSADSRYFYFTQAPWVDGCVVIPINGSTLERLDMPRREVQELYEGWAFFIALSPDETQLAYIASGHYDLVFRNLETLQERSLSLDPGWDFSAGYLSWSPDGKYLALTLANWPCRADDPSIEPFAKSTSTVVVDAGSLQARTLISEDPEHRIVLGWASATLIELSDPAGKKSTLDITE